MKKYHHLSLDQRYQLENMLSSGVRGKSIAEKLGVSESTISREKARNSGIGERYDYLKANRKSAERRTNASKIARKIKGELESKIEECLNQYWSPEQISGRLALEGVKISHAAIYNYVHRNGREASFLRHGGRKYKRVEKSLAGIKHIPNRTDISERPAVVDEKSRLGDWEGDTIISHKSRCALLTLVDRKSKYLFARKIGRKTKKNTGKAIIKLLKNQIVRTITFDNGSEFAEHENFSKKLKAATYFARPYRSCDRGLNEHTNGLIRQFLPKKFDFRNVSNREIKIIENLLNNRPRKVLQYKTPFEVFNSGLCKKLLFEL